jgi:hypothetical protein
MLVSTCLSNLWPRLLILCAFLIELQDSRGHCFFAVDINQVEQIGALGGNIADVQKPKTKYRRWLCQVLSVLSGLLKRTVCSPETQSPRHHTLDLVECSKGETFQSNYEAYVDDQKELTKPSTTPRSGEEVALDIAYRTGTPAES